MKYTDETIGRYIIKGENEPCMICKEPTPYIDILGECRICSTECMERWNEILCEYEITHQQY